MYLKSYQIFNKLEKHGGIDSGSSGGILVEVRVFSSAPSIKSKAYRIFVVSLFLFSFIHPLVVRFTIIFTIKKGGAMRKENL